MPVLPASDCIDRFLAVMRHCAPDARTAAELCQSVDAWGAYYRALRIALEGNILAGPANRAGCFFLFAQATLDGIAETVRGFFSLPWTRAAFSHRRLTQEFSRLCVVYHLTGET